MMARRAIRRPSGGVDLPPGSPIVAFDFTDENTLFQTKEGATPVAAIGDRVGYATDITGNGYHVAAATNDSRFYWAGTDGIWNEQTSNFDNGCSLQNLAFSRTETDYTYGAYCYVPAGWSDIISGHSSPYSVINKGDRDNGINYRDNGSSTRFVVDNGATQYSVPPSGDILTILQPSTVQDWLASYNGTPLSGSRTLQDDPFESLHIGSTVDGKDSMMGYMRRFAIYGTRLAGQDLTDFQTWLQGTA